MARIRSIHPDACRSRKLAAVSPQAERLYWRLQTECDDEGRAEDHPQLIFATCMPLVPGVDAAVVDALLAELDNVDLLVRYEVDGERYLEITRFGDYQHPDKPKKSKHPAVTTRPRLVPDSSPINPLPLPSGEERSGEERRGAQESPAPPAPAAPRWGFLERMLPLEAGVRENERAAWLEAIGPELEASAESEAPDGPPKKFNAELKRVAFARWRTYCQKPQSQRAYFGAISAAEREQMLDFQRSVASEPRSPPDPALRARLAERRRTVGGPH